MKLLDSDTITLALGSDEREVKPSVAVPVPGLSRPRGDTAGFTLSTWIYSSLQTWFTALQEDSGTLLIVHDSLITNTKMVFLA